MGVPPPIVVGSSIAFNFFAKISGSLLHFRAGNVSLPAMRYLLAGTVPAMLAATWLFKWIGETHGGPTLNRVILLSVALILIGLSVSMLKSLRKAGNPGEPSSRAYGLRERLGKGDKVLLFVGGTVTSFFIQMTSIGAGAILVPFLMKALNSPRHVAGTSVLYGLAVTALGSALHFTLGNVWAWLVLLLVLGSIPGMYIGVKVTKIAHPLAMAYIFALLILGVGLMLLHKAWNEMRLGA